MLETNPGPGTYELGAPSFEELPTFVKKVLSFIFYFLVSKCLSVCVRVRHLRTRESVPPLL
jgi:hypothetical protein